MTALYQLQSLLRELFRGPFDEALINGDTATPGIRSLDGLLRRLMEEGER